MFVETDHRLHRRVIETHGAALDSVTLMIEEMSRDSGIIDDILGDSSCRAAVSHPYQHDHASDGDCGCSPPSEAADHHTLSRRWPGSQATTLSA